MATFKYKLQNVLRLREQQEGIKQKEYAQALEVLKVKTQIKQEINQSLNNSTQLLKDAMRDHIDPRRIKSQLNHHMLLEKKQALATEQVEQAKIVTEKQRQELLGAMKNKKTLEILKEKSLEEFKEQEKKEEQQVVDEIVSFGYTTLK